MSQISGLRQLPLAGDALPSARTQDLGPGFREKLEAFRDAAPSPASSKQPLRFSNHAIDRMQARGVRFSPDEMAKIEQAVSKAAAKGAKDTLLLTDREALIVSVKDNVIVTVMDKSALKENVFTNI